LIFIVQEKNPSKKHFFSRIFFPQLNHFSSSSTSSSSQIVIHELQVCLNPSPLSSSNFLWSKYFSLIGERSVSDEFFDHYLASIESGFEIDMKLEYCYDIQRDLYWLTQIQLVSHSLILLHYVGLPEDDTSNDFWAYIYGERCHPIGWCKENSKLMLPPPIVTKRAIQQVPLNNNIISNGNEKQSTIIKGENEDINQTPPTYLFDKVKIFLLFISDEYYSFVMNVNYFRKSV
jgi:hypothetical protein